MVGSLKNSMYNLEYMKNIARKKGGECLSNEFNFLYDLLEWKCRRNHTWKSRAYVVVNGHWCRKCSKMVYNIHDMQLVAKENGGECLSKYYDGLHRKLEWKCSEGHIFKTKPRYVINLKTWCPYCAKVAKKDIHDMRKLARKHGGFCLSKEYVNMHTKLLWQCKKRHVWAAIPLSVRNGEWCPECAGNKKLTLQDAQDFAKGLGGQCLSDTYGNCNSIMVWECVLGHVFNLSFSSVRRGWWCPVCKKENRDKNKDSNMEK